MDLQTNSLTTSNPGKLTQPAVLMTDQERTLLERYGGWLQSLAEGSQAPTTDEQRRFVQVARGELEPQTPFETAWIRAERARQVYLAPITRDDMHAKLERLSVARAASKALQTKYEERRKRILDRVRPQLEALEAEFGDSLRAAKVDAEHAEADVRRSALDFGHSCRHAGIQASVTLNRVSWDGKGLAEFMIRHPEIAQFRREQRPIVSIRYLPDEDG
jgi:hypothetical protein